MRAALLAFVSFVLIGCDGKPRMVSMPSGASLTIYIPPQNPAGTVVVIVPGGGYDHLTDRTEGVDVAEWLVHHGVAAAVLRYRLGDSVHYMRPSDDGVSAVEYVRANARAYGWKPSQVGLMGFSAGGHLAAMVATSGDPLSRPNFLILAYPVISMEDGYAEPITRKNLLGSSSDPALLGMLSADQRVTSTSPPTFIYATKNDPVVSVANSVAMYDSLQAHGVSADLLVLPGASHGMGMSLTDPFLRQWSDRLLLWMGKRGFV